MHLLLVEDEQDVRALIADYLRNEGWEVTEAANAAEAKRLLADNSESIEFVLSDVRMPGAETGAALAKYIHRNYPRIPVLLASGNATHEEVDGEQFIMKPFRLDRLIFTIRAILAGEP